MEKKKMSNRDKMVLFIIGAIALVACAYFFGFQKLNEKKATITAENQTLREEVSRLENMQASIENVQLETKNVQKDIIEKLEQFPSEVRTQNAIYYLNRMSNAESGIPNVSIVSEAYSMNNLFYQPGGVIDGETVVAAEGEAAPAAQEETPAQKVTQDTPVSDIVSASANYYGYRSDINVAFTTPYESLKEVINYINKSEDRMTITDVSATRSEETNELTCNMNLSMYSISGTGEEYKQPEIKNNDAGVDNIFRN